jgi:hypothetical protein
VCRHLTVPNSSRIYLPLLELLLHLLCFLLFLCSIPCKTGLTTPEEASTSITACKLAIRGYHLQFTTAGAPQSGNTTANSTQDLAAALNSSSTAPNGLQNVRDPLYVSVTAALCPPNTYQDGETTQQQCTPCPHDLRTEQVRASFDALRDGSTTGHRHKPR